MNPHYWVAFLSLMFLKASGEQKKIDEKSDEITLKGKIILKDYEKAGKLKHGSCFVVTLEEEIMDDGPRSIIRQGVKYNPTVKRSGSNPKEYWVEYSLVFKRPPGPYYILSGHLNNGWCSEKPQPADEGKWIKKGDFLADTNYHVEFNSSKNVVKINIEFLYYNYSG